MSIIACVAAAGASLIRLILLRVACQVALFERSAF
jgi:hypothetical protein